MGSGRKSAEAVASFIKTKYPERFRAALVYAVKQDPAFMEASLQAFQDRQQDNKFWHNRTYQALQKMRVTLIDTGDKVGWRMYNIQDYALYLELANDRKHAAIAPIMAEFGAAYIRYARQIAKA